MTQYLDPRDDFTENATGYGASLAGYYKRFVAWTSDITTGYAIACPVTPISSSLIDLHNGYPPYAAFRNVATPADTFGACLFRPIYPPSTGATSKGTVRLTFSLLDVLGVHGADSFRYAGVCARASGQSANESSGSERLIGGQSYWFVLANKAGVGTRWLLLRVVGGSVSTLDSTPATIADISQPINISMMVETVGPSTPHIVCKHDTAEIFNRNDTDGSALTTAGRFGFGMCRDRQVAGVNTVAVAHAFEIDDHTDAIVHRDEWDRVDFAIPKTVAADGNGTSGMKSLMCGWTGDEHASLDPADWKTEVDRITNNNVNLKGITLRRATSPYVGHRSAVVWFTAAGASTQSGRFQLFLRGTNLLTTIPPQPGYAFVLAVGVGPVFTASIRYGSLGSLIVATCNVTALPGVGLSQNMTMDFKVYNVGVGAPTTGTPHMIAKLNGVILGVGSFTWTPGLDFSGFVIKSDGSIEDTRPGAYLSGEEEAIHSTIGSSGLGMFTDTWAEEDLTVEFGQAHTSQHILEGFARIGVQPAEPVFVPDTRVSTSVLEGFYGIPPEARFSQSIIEGFYGTVVPEAKLSQSILEGFYSQDLSAGAPPDACVRIAASGPETARVNAAGVYVRVAAARGDVERVVASSARVAAVSASGARIERLAVTCG
jgi:hypothetical protein